MPDSRLLRSLTLARGGLDRAAERRGDEAWFDAAWADPSSRVLVVHRGKAIVVGHGGITAGVPWTDPTYDGSVQGHAEGERGSVSLVLVAPQDVAHDGVRVLLSVDGDTAYLARLVDGATEPWDAPDGTRWDGLREVGAALGDRDADLFVMAAALGNWHATHPRCPRCGAATQSSTAGWSRTCEVDASQHFPRSDPAVIVLITDAPAHNGPFGSNAYVPSSFLTPSNCPLDRPGCAAARPPHAYADAVAALARINARVIGINSGVEPYSGRSDLAHLATDTGAVAGPDDSYIR